jgi:hypothetical protein
VNSPLRRRGARFARLRRTGSLTGLKTGHYKEIEGLRNVGPKGPTP